MFETVMFILFLSVSNAEREAAPVFVLDYEKVLINVPAYQNPFVELQASEFAKIIEEVMQRSGIVVLFIEDSFCMEDISFKDKIGTPYYHLRQGLQADQVKFLPAVVQPFKTLKQYFPLEHFNIFHLSDTSTKLNLLNEKYKYFYIYFKDDINETRVTALRRHDVLIREVYSAVRLKSSRPSVAFYTGKLNPISMEKKSFVPIKPQKSHRQIGVTVASAGALFRFIGLYSTSGNRRSTFSQIPIVAEETWEKERLNTRMAYSDFELEFAFTFKEDAWIVDNVMLLEGGEEVGQTEMRVGAPWNCSYVCSEPLVIVNLRDGSAVTISHYQIQPFQSSAAVARNSTSTLPESVKPGFGPAINCGPYFNAQILSCLMVTFVCLSILVYGVVSMYNCYSNDRYDDAHGKPLVIAAEGR